MNFIATKCVFSACSCYVRTERITTADLNTRGNVITYTSSSGEVILQIYSHPYLDLFSHFKRKKQTKKKHVQTDTNVKHREKKVQIFWRRFVFSFLVFFCSSFFLNVRNFFNFSAPPFSFLSASVQMPSLCALCSRLSF